MNCIYKINKYKLFLFIITNVNILNELFYVIFCFLVIEEIKNYL